MNNIFYVQIILNILINTLHNQLNIKHIKKTSSTLTPTMMNAITVSVAHPSSTTSTPSWLNSTKPSMTQLPSSTSVQSRSFMSSQATLHHRWRRDYTASIDDISRDASNILRKRMHPGEHPRDNIATSETSIASKHRKMHVASRKCLSTALHHQHRYIIGINGIAWVAWVFPSLWWGGIMPSHREGVWNIPPSLSVYISLSCCDLRDIKTSNTASGFCSWDCIAHKKGCGSHQRVCLSPRHWRPLSS